MHSIGILLALAALVCWGFGDFLIQRTSRDFGIWPSLFCITGAGAVILFPFAYQSLNVLFNTSNIIFLLFLGVITLVVALLEFKALKIGKIAVIEPVMSFELPLTVLLSVIILHESLAPLQFVLILVVFGGILLVGYTGEKIHGKHLLERGVLIALGATIIMATVNLSTGIASQKVGPVETIWFVHTFLAIACMIYFSISGTWHTLTKHIYHHPFESISVAVCDNLAWIFYASATTIIPISLAITVSESYIILAIVLGVIINKEKLLAHQWIGVVISIISVLILSGIS